MRATLCVCTFKVCCPKNTFGPTCEACPGGVDDPCGGRGSCEVGTKVGGGGGGGGGRLLDV